MLIGAAADARARLRDLVTILCATGFARVAMSTASMIFRNHRIITPPWIDHLMNPGEPAGIARRGGQPGSNDVRLERIHRIGRVVTTLLTGRPDGHGHPVT